MDDAERQSLSRAAQSHRSRAALARDEAILRGPAWWGHDMLMESADYYERRALELERQMETLSAPGPAPSAARKDEQA